MKPLNVVAESLKSLGVDSRAVAQATGISETNLTAAPSKKCANAPTLGALFAESPDPVTLFERMLKEGTPGFATDEKLTTSLHGLTAALKLAENAEDPQARLAVIVRAVQLAERAGVSKTRQEAAQAFAAWIAGVYLRGIPGGSTKMEVELRVELARAIEQRDDLSKMLADAEVGHAAELEDAAKRAMLSSDSLHNARMAEIRGIAAILGATEEESLEDAARRVVQEQVMEVQAERDSLRAEVTMLRDELKTQKAERAADQNELAELAIELGQQVGERLITAARRVREMGTHAEVHTDEEAARALVKERDELAANLGQKYVILDSRQIVGNCARFWRPDGAGYTCFLVLS